MSSDKKLNIRPMEITDLGFADSLRATIGWNQTVQDWKRLLALEPQGCFIAEWDGKPAGTATTTCYGDQLAWIGMVMVHPDYRSHGIGKSLLNHALHFLKSRGIACIKLDATPMGKPLYEKLGFQTEWMFTRWEIEVPDAGLDLSRLSHRGEIRSLHEEDWNSLMELDRPIFGVRRFELLKALSLQSQSVVVEDDLRKITGYGMRREGSKADYLGPVVAGSAQDVESMVAKLLAGVRGKPLFWDVPDSNTDAVRLVENLGFKPQRPLIRMFMGENRNPGIPSQQSAIADPTTG